jgi:hypothetical protein
MIIGLFWFWVVGACFAFLFFNSQGDREDQYPHRWIATYTLKQEVAFSLTWFIWFIRAWVRAIVWVLIQVAYHTRDMAVHVWDKWRNE